jgi:hypothetical protein
LNWLQRFRTKNRIEPEQGMAAVNLEMARRVELFYRCSDDEVANLDRRRRAPEAIGPERRKRAAAAGSGQLLNLALLALCDEIDAGDAITIEVADGPVLPAVQRKVRIPEATRERVDRIVARLPDVSRDQFVRVALRRWTRAY